MADNKRGAKRKGPNPATIFLVLAVLTYFLGLPFPVTAFLAFIAFILFRAQKDAKKLKDLPVPPLANGPSNDESGNELSTDFGRTSSDEVREWLRQHMPSDETEQPNQPDPTPAPRSVDRQSSTAARSADTSRTRAAAPAARSSPYRLNTAAGSRDLALQLKTGQGLRQAIVAMTVLGPPRALDAYVADPMQSASPSSVKQTN